MIGQYAVSDTVAVESSMLLSFSTLKHMSMASRAILSNFFEKQCLKTTHNTFRDCGVHVSDNLSRNSCIPNLRSIQSSCSANFFDRHLACTP